LTHERAAELWRILANSRNGILATIGSDGGPHLSNIYYLFDAPSRTALFSTTTVRVKGRNLLRDPRATLHVSGRDFFNFAVATGPASISVPQTPDDDAVELLYRIHEWMGATSERNGFGEQMLADHRMAVELRVERLYGQILDRPARSRTEGDELTE
jgi:PPOX class probable F420-dependent enzyme